MKEAMVTFVAPLRSLEDRILGNAEVFYWEIDKNHLIKPNSIIVSLDYYIPSKTIHIGNSSIQRAIKDDFSNLFSYLFNQFKKVETSIASELLKIKSPNSKAYTKKQKLLDAISLFLATQENRVYLESHISHENLTYALHIPFLDSRDFPIGFSQYFQIDQKYKKYNSITQGVKRQLNFPFSRIYIKEKENTKKDSKNPNHPNLTLKENNFSISTNNLKSAKQNKIDSIITSKDVFSVDFISLQKGVALDIETTNYLPLLLPENFNALSEEEIRNYLEKNQVLSRKALLLKDKKGLLKITKDFLDIQRDERITTISLASPDFEQNYLLTTFDSKLESILVDSPLNTSKHPFKIIKYVSQIEMIEGLIKKIDEINPLFVYGHNQLKFDYQKLSEFSLNGFNSGINGASLKYIHSILGQYIVQRILPGRIDIDPALYSQFYMSNKNNKLDQVFEALTGKFSKKTLTHKELEEYTKLAEAGDIKKAQEILYYAAQDVLKSHIIGELLKREHILLSRLYSSLPARIDTTSPRSLVEEYWSYNHLKKFNNFPNTDIANETIVLDKKSETKDCVNGISQANKKILKFHDFDALDFFLKDILKKEQNIKARNTFEDAYLIYVSPVLSAFIPLIKEDDNVENILTEIKYCKPQKRLRLSRSLNNLCDYPYFKFIQSKVSFQKEFNYKEPKSKKLKTKNSIAEQSDQTYQEITNRLSNAAILLKAILTCPDFLNIKKDLVLLKESDDSKSLINDLESKSLGFSLGKYKVLSGKKGVMLGANDSWSFMLGISDPDSKRGEKTPFEADFEKEFIDALINQNDKIKSVLIFSKYVKIIANDLKEYKLDESINHASYQVEKTLRRDSSNFSSHGMSNYKKTAIKNHANEGDIITISKTKEELYTRFFNCVPFGDLDDEIKHIFSKKGLPSHIKQNYMPLEKSLDENNSSSNSSSNSSFNTQYPSNIQSHSKQKEPMINSASTIQETQLNNVFKQKSPFEKIKKKRNVDKSSIQNQSDLAGSSKSLNQINPPYPNKSLNQGVKLSQGKKRYQSKNPKQLSFDFSYNQNEEYYEKNSLSIGADSFDSGSYLEKIALDNSKINYAPNEGKLTRLLTWAFKISNSNIKKRALYKIISHDYPLIKEQSKNEFKDELISSCNQNKHNTKSFYCNQNLLDLIEIIIKE